MTKRELGNVVDALVKIVSGWNEAAEDGDRGEANDAITLTLWDDGSGRIGKYRQSGRQRDEVDAVHEFNGIDELAKILEAEEDQP